MRNVITNFYVIIIVSIRGSCIPISVPKIIQSNINILDPPEMPQDAAAVEIPSRLDPCVLLISWNHPNNIDSSDIDHYIVRTSHESEVPEINDTTTLATFLSPCSELSNILINVTAVDSCGRIGVPTKNFAPQLVHYTEAPPPTANIVTVTVTVPPITEYPSKY